MACAFGVQFENRELSSAGFLHVCSAGDGLRALPVFAEQVSSGPLNVYQ